MYSYGTALLAYSMLLVLAFITRRNPLGTSLLAASALTAVWAGLITISTVLPEPQTLLIQLSEVARNAAWVFFLLSLIGIRMRGTDHILASRRWMPWFVAGFALILVIVLGIEPLVENLSLAIDLSAYTGFGIWLIMSIAGLLLLEQLFRNSNEAELWSIKHLCLGLGILFAYDFFMYAEALLFRLLDATVWQARGIVTALAAALIAVSISRTDTTTADEPKSGINLSHHVAFHSLTLMAAGIYLVAMALAAYFIRFLGGNWGGVLQIAFLAGAGLTLIALLFSGRIRAYARVWLSKNFFSYKYDYRLEWLQFTQTLASGDNNVPENITRAVANLAKSPAGILWSKRDEGKFVVHANWEMPNPGRTIDLHDLPAWLEDHGWIIDLREWRTAPDLYRNLKLPHALLDIPRAWLIIPLLFSDRLQGVLLLKESDIPLALNWEDRDLLKVAGRQAASHLAQYQADQALVESRQFEAFNRLSAYVIHDLKNILAQLSLVVANAQKHKHNPEFIDDMVNTVNNSVNRMSKLMVQLRGDAAKAAQEEFAITELLEQVIAESALREPVPELDVAEPNIKLQCDKDRLQTVFSHLIQNAQEATERQGKIFVRLYTNDNHVVVEIEDNGVGMDDLFIQERLFKPFDSTKGLTGMGIGAFESRDFIRSMDGDISVQSTPGEGSLFRVNIPTHNGTILSV